MRTALAIALSALTFNANAVLVCSSTNDYDPPQVVSWYVGQPAPSINVGPEQYVVCAANGVELAFIGSAFADLPMRGSGNGRGSRVVIWRGEAATFLLDNLS